VRNYTAVHSFGAHTFNFNVAGGTDFNSNLPPYDGFSLGPLNLRATRSASSAAGAWRLRGCCTTTGHSALPDLLGSGLYFGASAEAGRVKGSFVAPADSGKLYSGSVFLGADTFLGPAYLGVGFGRDGRHTCTCCSARPDRG
jgi:NTE family protein